LRRRDNGYAAALEALVAISEVAPDKAVLAELRKEKIEDPSDLAALDQAWEEAEVRFGPGDAASDGCPRVSDILQRMDVPAGARAGEPLVEAGT
jgi:nitrate reductase delta subunit